MQIANLVITVLERLGLPISVTRAGFIAPALRSLPPQCRAAFTLRIFHECSYKEVAERLGISVKTVEKHISRAIRETNSYLKGRYSVPRRQRHG